MSHIKAMFTEGMAFRLNLIGRFALVNIALIRPHNVYTFATGTCSEGSHRTPCKRGWHISAAANTVARYEPQSRHTNPDASFDAPKFRSV